MRIQQSKTFESETPSLSLKRSRIYFTIEKKLEILTRINQGESFKSIAKQFKINRYHIFSWMKNIERFKSSTSLRKKTLHKGPNRRILVDELEFLQQIKKSYDEGNQKNYNTEKLFEFAKNYFFSLGEKNVKIIISWVYRFFKKYKSQLKFIQNRRKSKFILTDQQAQILQKAYNGNEDFSSCKPTGKKNNNSDSDSQDILTNSTNKAFSYTDNQNNKNFNKKKFTFIDNFTVNPQTSENHRNALKPENVSNSSNDNYFSYHKSLNLSDAVVDEKEGATPNFKDFARSLFLFSDKTFSENNNAQNCRSLSHNMNDWDSISKVLYSQLIENPLCSGINFNNSDDNNKIFKFGNCKNFNLNISINCDSKISILNPENENEPNVKHMENKPFQGISNFSIKEKIISQGLRQSHWNCNELELISETKNSVTNNTTPFAEKNLEFNESNHPNCNNIHLNKNVFTSNFNNDNSISDNDTNYQPICSSSGLVYNNRSMPMNQNSSLDFFFKQKFDQQEKNLFWEYNCIKKSLYNQANKNTKIINCYK